MKRMGTWRTMIGRPRAIARDAGGEWHRPDFTSAAILVRTFNFLLCLVPVSGSSVRPSLFVAAFLRVFHEREAGGASVLGLTCSADCDLTSRYVCFSFFYSYDAECHGFLRV